MNTFATSAAVSRKASGDAATPTPAPTPQEEILWALEQAAPSYNAWLLSRALPHVGMRTLEVGAGIGTFTLPLAALGTRVTALEPDATLAKILGERTQNVDGLRVLQESLEALNGNGRKLSVDSILCFNVLEHVADDGEALKIMRGCLSPSGQLLLLVPAHPFLFGRTDRAVHHERRYTKKALGHELARAGFEVVQLRYVNPLGALGWLLSSRILRRETLNLWSLKVFESILPLARSLDRVRLPLGLSVWARARRSV